MLVWLAVFLESVFSNWVIRPCVLSLLTSCFGGLLFLVYGCLVVSGLSDWLVLEVAWLVVFGSVWVLFLVWSSGWLASSCLCVSSLIWCLLVGSGSFRGVSCGAVRSGFDQDL